MIWNKIADDILCSGISLHEYGVNNVAIPYADALEALSKLEAADIGVLGGDVYLRENGIMTVTYDNWFCDHLADEFLAQFVIRSVSIAKSYVSNYQNTDAYFAIVLDL